MDVPPAQRFGSWPALASRWRTTGRPPSFLCGRGWTGLSACAPDRKRYAPGGRYRAHADMQKRANGRCGAVVFALTLAVLVSAVRGPLAGAEAGRGCAGEQPSGIASGVSTDEGVPRGRTPRSAVRFLAGARLQMENHRTAAELSLWARVDWLVGLRSGSKKIRSRREIPCSRRHAKTCQWSLRGCRLRADSGSPCIRGARAACRCRGRPRMRW